MYTTTDMGNTPYNTKVKMAPSTVPCVLNASANAIIKVT
jgi:hypothetical protein